MTSIKVLLRTDKKKKNGESPLYVRLIQNRKPKLRSLGLSLLPRHWDADRERVRKSHPNSARFNAFIAKKKAEYEKLALDVEEGVLNLNDRTLRQAQLGDLNHCFISYCRKKGEQKHLIGNYGAAKKAMDNARRLEFFSEHIGKPITFAHLTVKFLDDFEQFLFEVRGNMPYTVNGALRFICARIREAVREGLFPKDRNPFPDKTIHQPESPKDFLSLEQLKALEELPYKPGSWLWNSRNMFVFSSYAGGIRWSDTAQLKWEFIRGNVMVFNQKKTGSQNSVLLVDNALKILDLYRPVGKALGLVFPVLRPEVMAGGGEAAYHEAIFRNKLVNRHLKQIGKDAGLPFPLKYHSSRHTFATWPFAVECGSNMCRGSWGISRSIQRGCMLRS